MRGEQYILEPKGRDGCRDDRMAPRPARPDAPCRGDHRDSGKGDGDPNGHHPAKIRSDRLDSDPHRHREQQGHERRTNALAILPGDNAQAGRQAIGLFQILKQLVRMESRVRPDCGEPQDRAQANQRPQQAAIPRVPDRPSLPHGCFHADMVAAWQAVPCLKPFLP